MERYKQIERTIITTYRKQIWSKFIKAITEYEMIQDGDKIGIYVTSENGYYKKVYTITIHFKKEVSIMSNFLKFLIAGLGVLLVSLLVIISANKRAKRRVKNKDNIVDSSQIDENK